VRFLTTAAALRDWFDANHATATELWLGYHRKATGRSDLDWSAAVDEALCVGWIDGVRYRLDETSFAQRFTPRRRGSTWSAINVAKVEALTREGRMRPAGLAAFAARTPDRTAIYSYERGPATLTEAETAALRAVPAAWADWQSRPPSYRNGVTHWVTSAKQPATRERRLAALIEDSAAGRKIKPMRVGRDA
jgi:uncharacterized protein YdeI (YjbR/CyaY-like superfamily)